MFYFIGVWGGLGACLEGTRRRDNRVVATVPRTVVPQEKIAKALLKAEAALRPDVIRIRWGAGTDWTGDHSLFFRVVLSDDASKPKHLQEVAQRVADTIVNEVQNEAFGFNAYFNFRSKTEQDALKEPAWA